MSESDMKTLYFSGIRNPRYCMRNEDGSIGAEVKDLPMASGLTLTPQFNTQAGYANDTKIYAIPSDQGYQGTYGCTGQDEAFERALGMIIDGDDGLPYSVGLQFFKKFDLYYEFTLKPEKGNAFIVKRWVYGVEIGKPTWQHDTNKDQASIGQYQYPITVYGEKLMDDVKPYTDEYGFEYNAYFVRAIKSDSEYKEFGTNPPPVPKKTA